MPPEIRRRAARNSQTDQNDDCQHCACTHRYPTHEINYNGLNAHFQSVDRIGAVRNVTLIPMTLVNQPQTARVPVCGWLFFLRINNLLWATKRIAPVIEPRILQLQFPVRLAFT